MGTEVDENLALIGEEALGVLLGSMGGISRNGGNNFYVIGDGGMEY